MDKSNSVPARFLTYFNQQFLGKKPKILAAVSAGIDSVAMAYLFKLHHLPFAVAHVNFELRQEESEGDQQLVAKLAKSWGVPFYTARLNAEKAAQQPGVSIQMAARNLRYAWFEEIRKKHGLDLIATAHHANDSVETLLYNLTKGTGLAGLHGILPLRGKLYRPLLPFKKSELLEFAQSEGLSWREDRSNASDKYARNLIRNQVVPTLKKLNPELEQAFQRTAQRVQKTESILAHALHNWRKEVFQEKENGTWILEQPLGLLPEPETLLQQWVAGYGFTQDQVSDLWQKRRGGSFPQEVGKVYYAASHQLTCERNGWFLTKRKQQKANVETLIAAGVLEVGLPDGKLVFQRKPALGHTLNPQKEVAAFDMQKLQFPLQLRPWQEGDTFRPLGMKGFKKVSDFLTDQKIPAHQKQSVHVLLSQHEICWVVGLRIDDRFKMTPATQELLEIRLLGRS